MMDLQYDAQVDRVTKTLESWIKAGSLTPHPQIRLDAISHSIVGDLNELIREQDERRRVSEMFITLQKFFPKIYEEFFPKLKDQHVSSDE